ncbi:MAG: hypothetical protein ABSC61_00300 [Anaerolineales bacterium]
MTNIGPDCIISYIDMIDTGELLNNSKGVGVTIIRNMHDAIMKSKTWIRYHEEICFWNDSVLLLAKVDVSQRDTYKHAIDEVRKIKKIIDRINSPKGSFVVCVKGQAFPPPVDWKVNEEIPRMNYLQASSLAFANCFTIIDSLKNNDIHWYIEERIIEKVKLRKEDSNQEIDVFPRKTKRVIFMFTGDIYK